MRDDMLSYCPLLPDKLPRGRAGRDVGASHQLARTSLDTPYGKKCASEQSIRGGEERKFYLKFSFIFSLSKSIYLIGS